MSVSKHQFPGFPEEKSVRHFRNILIQLKKTLMSSKKIDEINQEMEHFINANRKVVWPHQTQEVFRKEEAEKAIAKITTEFQRYVSDLKKHQGKESFQDLMEAILVLESIIDQIR